MTGPANDPQAVRPEVVLLLLDIDQAAGGIGNGAACCGDGRLLDRGDWRSSRAGLPPRNVLSWR